MPVRAIDRSALRTNQAVIVLVLLVAFVARWPGLVPLVAVLMAIGAARRRPAFGVVYTRLVRPAGWLAPETYDEDPAPHAFAQALGAAVLLLATGAFLARLAPLGWGLAGLVAALAALNLATGFCAGCAIHYQLGRLRRSAPADEGSGSSS